MMVQSRTAAVVVGVACVLLFAGCGSAEGGASSPSSATSEPSAAQSSSPPSPVVTPSPDRLDTDPWLITEDGIGPVALFSDVLETEALVEPDYRADGQCEGLRLFESTTPGPATSLFTSDDGSGAVHDVTVRAPEPFSTPSDTSPRTAEGITLGTQTGELLDTYPTLAPITAERPHFVLPLGESFLLFEVTDGESVIQGITVSRSEDIAGFCG